MMLVSHSSIINERIRSDRATCLFLLYGLASLFDRLILEPSQFECGTITCNHNS